MDNKFKNFVNKLKNDSTATHFDLDVTWDIPNLLINSNELLLLMLTKTTMIPFIENYTSISNDLGLSQEQSISVQETNVSVLNLHKMIQQYCIQQFAFGSMMKSQMDNIIMSSPEIQDVQSVDDLLNYIQNFKSIQSQNGGVNFNKNILTFMANMILFIILILPISKAETVNPEINQKGQLQLVLNGNNVIEPYNKAILGLSLEDYSQMAIQSEYVKSRTQTNVNNIIVRYDRDIEKQKTQLVTQFLSLFQTQQSGIEFLQEIIENFNSGLSDFSEGAEKICFELMDKANNNGVFEHFMDFDTLDETTQKIDKIEKDVEKYNSELTEKTANVTMATLASTALNIAVTGDVTQALNEAVPYILELGSSLFDSLTNTKKIVEQTQQIVTQQQANSTQLSTQEKTNLENKIYQFSKLYCSFGYSLQLQLEGTNINVIGGKIEYEWLLSVVALLENNIDFKITKLSLNKDLNKSELNALISLKQRLQILKAITQKISQIVNFSIQAHISKLQVSPTADSLERIQTYFNNQLQDLLNMLEQIKKQFPKREQQLQESTILLEVEKELDKMEDNQKLQQIQADNERQQRQNEMRQRISEMKAENISASWVASEIIAKSYINLALNVTDFAGESLANMTKAFGDIGLKIPLGLASSILDFINQILYLLIKNPAGWLLLGSGLLVVTFWLGGIIGIIRIFKFSGELFVTITYGSVMFIYKLIKTPFGWIYKKQDVIAVPQIEYSESESDAANALLQLKKSTGGKKTKKYKNIFNKTRQIKKRHNKNKTKKRIISNKKKYTRRHK